MRLASLAAVLVLVTACGNADDDDDVADVSALVETGDTGALAQALVTTTAGSPSEIAEHVARHALGALYPAGCATHVIVDGHARLTLAGCTGPFGKRVLDGGLDFGFAIGADGVVTATITSAADLTANGLPLAYAGTASWTPGSLVVRWNAHAAGTTARGRVFDKSATITLTVDPVTVCSTLEGNVSGTVAGRGVDIQVTDYKVCGSDCPSSGEIVKTKEAKLGRTKVKHISFDGTASASVVDPKGRTRAVPLVCGEDAE